MKWPITDDPIIFIMPEFFAVSQYILHVKCTMHFEATFITKLNFLVIKGNIPKKFEGAKF